MTLKSLQAGLVSFTGAMIASLCCLLPLTVVLLGLGSGAFMMVTMQYRSIFLPAGVVSVGLGYYLDFREKRRCTTIGCSFVAKRTNLALLVFAMAVVGGALILDFFPELTSGYLQMVM